MSNFSEIIKNLKFHENGFWVSEQSTNISYPKDGNELCAEIEDSSFWFRHRNNVISSVIKNFPPEGAVFDIGGGNGYVVKNLIENGFDCVLIEPGIYGADRAVKRGVTQVICATIESIDLKKKSIPNIGLFDVIEHIEDDITFLTNLSSLLVSGGRVYATVPAYNFLWSDEDVYAGHFRRYTLNSISELFNKAGLQIEYVTYFFRFLPIPIFLLRTLPSFIGLKSSNTLEATKKEHTSNTGLSDYFLRKVFNAELKQINNKKSLLFGASCFIVAKS